MKSLWVLLATVSAFAQESALYLTPSPPGEYGGTGEQVSPLKIPSGAVFDAVLSTATSSKIILGEGVFETLGIWNFQKYSTALNPVHIQGSGMDRTTIRLSTNAVTLSRPDLTVVRLGVPYRNNSGPFVVEDLTIDGNEQAFPTNTVVTGGLIIHANHSTVRNVKVVGIRGSFALHHEAFGILINNFADGWQVGPDGNNHVIGCIVESSGEYVSPIYVGTFDQGRPVKLSHIRDCVTRGVGPKPMRLGVSLQSDLLIEGHLSENVEYAIYNDYNPVKYAIVRDSVFKGVTYAGLFVILESEKSTILAKGNVFEYQPTPGMEWIGAVVWDKYTNLAKADFIMIKDNTFRLAPGATASRPFSPIVAKGDVTNSIFGGGSVPSGFRPPVLQGVVSMAPIGVSIGPFGTNRQPVFQ